MLQRRSFFQRAKGCRARSLSSGLPTVAFVLIGLIALSTTLAGCTSSSGVPGPSSHPFVPSQIIPTPAGLIASAQPQPNGTVWVLSGTTNVKTLTNIEFHTGAVATTVAASADATDLVESSTGQLAVSTATATTGAVELHNATSGALVNTVPTPGPVESLAPGVAPNGDTVFYALIKTPSSDSVSVVDATSLSVTHILPAPDGIVGLVPSPDQQSLWLIAANGTLTRMSTGNASITGTFQMPGVLAQAISISPDGNTLYILDSNTTAPVASLIVVSSATGHFQKILPAPTNSVDIAISPDGTIIYYAVGTRTIGNLQSFLLPPGA